MKSLTWIARARALGSHLVALLATSALLGCGSTPLDPSAFDCRLDAQEVSRIASVVATYLRAQLKLRDWPGAGEQEQYLLVGPVRDFGYKPARIELGRLGEGELAAALRVEQGLPAYPADDCEPRPGTTPSFVLYGEIRPVDCATKLLLMVLAVQDGRNLGRIELQIDAPPVDERANQSRLVANPG